MPQTSQDNRAARPGLKQKPWGAYRRAIRIAADSGVVCAEMEDDIHHFRLTLTHDGGVAIALMGEAIRTPWTNCPGALPGLSTLNGKTFDHLLTLATVERSEQCMHLYDLVLLAVNHAGQDQFRRHYRIEGDYDAAPPRMQLWRDGAELLSWSEAQGQIYGSAYDGMALKDLGPIIAAASPDEAEALLVLRRATLIAGVRVFEMDRFASADAINPNAPPVCYARQPQRSPDALRVYGSARDFDALHRWPLDDEAHPEESRP